MKKKWSLFILLLVGGILFNWPQSLAEAEELQFSVKAILPENQVNKKRTYFDLRMQPGTKQQVEVELTNSVDKDIQVDMRLAAATTAMNGVAAYPDPVKEKVVYDQTLKYPLQDVAKIQSSVVIPQKGQVRVPIEITMPADPFQGMIIGAIVFQQKESSDLTTDSKQKSGMGIKNKFAYQVGMKLTESDEPVSVDLKLLKVYAGQLNYRNVIYANLQNPTSEIMRNLQIDSKVFRKGQTKPIFEIKKNDMQMAPNSNFDFPIPLDNKAFQAGKYVLKMAASADPDHTWEFTKDFSITVEQAKKLNAASVDNLEYETNWWLWIGLGIGLVFLVIIIVIVIKKQKYNKHAVKRKGHKRVIKSHSKTNK